MLEINLNPDRENLRFLSAAVPRKGEYVHFDGGRTCFEVVEVYYDVQADSCCQVRVFAEQLAPVR